MINQLWETVVAICLLIVGAAFFASAETALFSLSRASREALAKRSDDISRRLLWLLVKPQRLIVTVIVCNELINILTASLAATQLEKVIPGASQNVQILLSTLVTVPPLLLFGELIPKSLAIRIGEPWARAVALPLFAVMLVITPIRWVLAAFTNVILWLFGRKRPRPEEGLREEEFRALVDVGSEVGELEGTEQKLIHRVFDFGDTTVDRVMSTADKIFALPYEMPLGRLVEAIAQERFSRVPIYRSRKRSLRSTVLPLLRRSGSGGVGAIVDPEVDIVGILFAKDVVGYAYGQLEGHTIQELLHPPLFVPRTTKCDQLFRVFQRRKTHLALVVDEYGRLVGLVTMDDLLDELFGGITEKSA